MCSLHTSSLTYISCVNIHTEKERERECCLYKEKAPYTCRGGTDTLFTLYGPAQILRQVERVTPKFSRSIRPPRVSLCETRGIRERGSVDERSIRNTRWCAPPEKEGGAREEKGSCKTTALSKYDSQRNMSPTRTSRSLQTFGWQRACVLLHTET